MAFIRAKQVKGKTYYYKVEGIRENGKVRQKILQYFGTTPPPDYVVPIKGSGSVVTNKGIKKVGTTKSMAKVEPGVVRSKVSTTKGKALMLHLSAKEFNRLLDNLKEWNSNEKHAHCQFSNAEQYALNRLFHPHQAGKGGVGGQSQFPVVSR